MNTLTKNIAISEEDASKIVPRAEFRIFGHDLINEIEAKIWDVKATLYAARKMPIETYFLSEKTNDANVKVRDGLLDIKVKVGETKEGYEIFQPRGKFQFPVKKEELNIILSHLEVDIPLDKDSYEIEEFKAIVRQHPCLNAVTVEKMRYGFMVDGIICEFARVWFNGALMETACCESEDYEKMQAVVNALGINKLPNTNYLKAAKRVVGM
ncbi:TPA: hypothetical protein KEY68_002909 [Providencia rettgeri]|uniref:hypothetical protein n=1 Tax=Providencia TaxID=586 RepID=UPI001B37787C|nr:MULTISPECIES: hypothetical protein [Providencia]EMB5785586.1 hypothetical protein [Providencia rettgeri]MBQ0367641.1 hypothetical protein [Providencia rettgeri]MDK7744010.1 hypothetical protein [Providencia rettgeri]MDK7756733.1 hypothetical protein [Providencia rettgeri]HBC7430616.1 hypothetical protein [Providencia rettgeri]